MALVEQKRSGAENGYKTRSHMWGRVRDLTGTVFGLRRPAEELDAASPADVEHVADMIRGGRIVAFPFNGIFGLFGNVDNERAVDMILEAKNRPIDKKLIIVPLPEYVHEVASLERGSGDLTQLIPLWRDIHALGAILHAAPRVPHYMVNVDGTRATTLSIWTEYPPLRHMVEHFRKLGGKALVGTSANKSGQPTHWCYDELREDFRYNVAAVVRADFSNLPEIRRRSTTVVDFTENHPRLHREGNVTEQEVREAFQRHGFPPLVIGRDVITVRARK